MSAEARLFLLALVALLVGSGFAARGVLEGEEWVQLVAWLLGLVATGNGVGAVAKPAGEWLTARAAQIAKGVGT